MAGPAKTGAAPQAVPKTYTIQTRLVGKKVDNVSLSPKGEVIDFSEGNITDDILWRGENVNKKHFIPKTVYTGKSPAAVAGEAKHYNVTLNFLKPPERTSDKKVMSEKPKWKGAVSIDASNQYDEKKYPVELRIPLKPGQKLEMQQSDYEAKMKTLGKDEKKPNAPEVMILYIPADKSHIFDTMTAKGFEPVALGLPEEVE